MIISLTNPSFARVYREGKSKADHQIVMYQIENGLPYNRIGITVSKKIGNSVVRHRVKRIIKEAYRLHENEFQSGYDIVMIARKTAEPKKSTDMEISILRLGKRLGVLKEKA